MLEVRTIPVTLFEQNARLLFDIESKHLVVVDPGGDTAKLFSAIVDLAPEKIEIYLTHAHIDHAAGVVALSKAVEEQFGSKPALYAHRDDKPLRSSIGQQATLFGLSPSEYMDCPEPDIYLEHQDTFSIGSSVGTVLFTPGHAPGHISLYFAASEWREAFGGKTLTRKEPLLIAGDTLFAGSIGRTDLPGGNHELLLSKIKSELYTLPEETLVYPGHGPETTIGREKRTNPFVRDE